MSPPGLPPAERAPGLRSCGTRSPRHSCTRRSGGERRSRAVGCIPCTILLVRWLVSGPLEPFRYAALKTALAKYLSVSEVFLDAQKRGEPGNPGFGIPLVLEANGTADRRRVVTLRIGKTRAYGKPDTV